MRKAFLELHLAIFLAGFTAVLGKLIHLNEGLLVAWRLMITVVVLALLLHWKNNFRWPGAQDFFKMAGVGMLITIHWVAFYGSVKYGNISIALICLSCMSFFTALLEPIFFKRKINWFEVFLGLLAIAGIYIIFDFHPEFKLGIIFGIIAAIGSSIFPIFNKMLLNRHNPRQLTFFELGSGLIFLSAILPFYLHYFPASYWWPTASDWLWLIILAVLCTVVAVEFQLNALKKISPFTVALSYNLEPLYGIIMGFAIFNEAKYFGTGFYLGFGIILITLLVHAWKLFKSSR